MWVQCSLCNHWFHENNGIKIVFNTKEFLFCWYCWRYKNDDCFKLIHSKIYNL